MDGVVSERAPVEFVGGGATQVESLHGPAKVTERWRSLREEERVLDEYGFEKLHLVVDGLTHEFDVRWKLLPPTDGPPGFPGEPYIPLAVSFAMKSGDGRATSTTH